MSGTSKVGSDYGYQLWLDDSPDSHQAREIVQTWAKQDDKVQVDIYVDGQNGNAEGCAPFLLTPIGGYETLLHITYVLASTPEQVANIASQFRRSLQDKSP
jgi:hypothetical protein